jgi:hypothetical protein
MRILVPVASLLVPLAALAQATSAPAASSFDVDPAKAAKTEPARAGAPNAHLAAAQRLYQKLDLDAALAELQLAEGARGSEEEMVQILIYRGLIYSETGKTADASDQFKRALAMRPWSEVPPETSPRIAKTFNEARKSVWGMASVKPPKKRAPPAPSAMPAPATAPSAVPASTTAPQPGTLAMPAAAPANAPVFVPADPKADPTPAK